MEQQQNNNFVYSPITGENVQQFWFDYTVVDIDVMGEVYVQSGSVFAPTWDGAVSFVRDVYGSSAQIRKIELRGTESDYNAQESAASKAETPENLEQLMSEFGADSSDMGADCLPIK